MNCHICSEPALGQCPVCEKFFCSAHGDKICQRCSQLTASGREEGDQARLQLVRSDQHDLRHDDARRRWLHLDKSIPERVIEVIGSYMHGERTVTLVSLELYKIGFLADFRFDGMEGGQLPLGHVFVPRISSRAIDDKGGSYKSTSGTGKGNSGSQCLSCQYTPAVATEVRTLHVTIDDIEWIGYGILETRTVVEQGPWEFDVTL